MKIRLLLLLLCLGAAAFAQQPGWAVVPYAGTCGSQPCGATPTFTATAGHTIFEVTLAANITSSTFSSAAVGDGAMIICQPGSGGPYTMAFPANFLGFNAPSATASACTVYGWEYDGTNVYARNPPSSSSGGSTLLDHVGLQTEVSLTLSTDNVIYSYTIPGGTIPAGKCAQLTLLWAHTTGSASTGVKITFGGTSLSNSGTTGLVNRDVARVCNRAGSTSAQDMALLFPDGSYYSATPIKVTPAEDTTAAVVLKFTANPGTNASQGVTLYLAETEILR